MVRVSDVDELERLRRRLRREREARREAERLLEEKSRELFGVNQQLQNASVRLNAQLVQRTTALEAQKRELRARVEQLQSLQRSLEEAHDLAQAANRAKSRFIAMISHDIRTPVNGLLGSLVLLKETPLDARQQEWLSHALASGRQLRGLLADLIDLSQADAGAIRLEVVSVALREVLEEIVATWRSAAVARGLAMRLEIAPTVPSTVMGDSGRIRQVLENLLSNAVKYTQHDAAG